MQSHYLSLTLPYTKGDWLSGSVTRTLSLTLNNHYKIMKLRNVILGSLLGVFALGATANAQIGVIVRGGYQAANITGSSIDTKITHGARVGAAADITVYDGGMSRISIQPGVDFAMKGYKVGEIKKDDKAGLSTTTSLYYVDIPVLANFAFDLGNDLGVFVNAGPYLGVGVGGKVTGKGKIFGLEGKSEKDIKPFDKDNGMLNRLDWGAQVGAGVEYNHFQVGVGTQFGIGDIRNDKWKKANEDKAIRNSNFFVTVGYRF